MNKITLSLIALVLFLSACSTNKTSIGEVADYNTAELLPGRLSYSLPATWERVAVSSPLRVDQIIIDPVTQTELAVFFFEGMNNAVEANLARWKAQFTDDTRKLLDNRQFNQNKIPVTVFAMSGTYLRALQQLNPDSPKEELPGYAMYAIIAEMQNGTWFFKAYGPEPVIASQKENFETLIASLKAVKQ